MTEPPLDIPRQKITECPFPRVNNLGGFNVYLYSNLKTLDSVSTASTGYLSEQTVWLPVGLLLNLINFALL